MKKEILRINNNEVTVKGVWDILPVRLLNLRTGKEITILGHRVHKETISGIFGTWMHHIDNSATILRVNKTEGLKVGDYLTNNYE